MALALFALLAAVYLASPRRDLHDSKFALLTSESLVTRGSWDLTPYLPQFASRKADSSLLRGKVGYQLHSVDGRLVYRYPAGTSLLSAPFFAVQRLFGATTLGPKGLYSISRETRLQGVLAALFAALAVLLGYRVARRELPIGPAAAVALAAALGSSWWSVASRLLWSHTWTAVLLTAALLELLRWEDSERRRPVLLAALLVAAFWVRPTNSFSAVAFTAVVAWRHRAALARMVVAGAAGFALYLGFSLVVFSSWFPSYMRNVVPKGRLQPAEAFVGQLFSAGHGLFVFSPVLLAVAWLLVRRGVAPGRRAVAALSLGLVAFYLVYHSWRSQWWGAGTIGTRFLCDVTPYLLWLGAHAWRRAREAPRATPIVVRWLLRGAVALLALAGVAAHATGAFAMKREATQTRASEPPLEPGVARGSDSYWSKLPQARTIGWLGALLRAAAQEEGPRSAPRRKRLPGRDRGPEPAD